MAEQALAIRARLEAFRRQQLRHGDRVATSRGDHGSILNAMADGDGDLAARRMRAHMIHAASALRHFVVKTGDVQAHGDGGRPSAVD